MGWTLKTAERESIALFEGVIETIIERKNRRIIYIWGAGARGTLLGILLEKRGIADYLYIDSDEKKWGTNINGHLVKSLNEIDMKAGYVVVSVEHFVDIERQLLSYKMKKEEDFCIINIGQYDHFVSEFFRKYEEKYLVFGESFLSVSLLDEEPMECMRDLLYAFYGRDEMKILAMSCMGVEEYSYLLRKLISMGAHPEQFWIFTSFEMLAEHHHILPRTQHPNLMELIQKNTKDYTPDFKKYIELSKKRAENYKLERLFAPQRSYETEADLEEVQKEYCKDQFSYKISIESAGSRYLGEMLQICKDNHISATVIIIPYNYQKAIEFYGSQFEVFYEHGMEVFTKLASEYHSKLWDMSRMLSKEDFEASVTIQDAVKKKGRKKVIEFLRYCEKIN